MDNSEKPPITFNQIQAFMDAIKPFVDSNQETERENNRLEHEIAKMRLLGDSRADARNKWFVGSILVVSVVAVSILSYHNKLSEGLLTIFSMLIGGLFTAYATAIKWGAGKKISDSNTDNATNE
ncbi:hypothetical protein [Emticicia fontis]